MEPNLKGLFKITLVTVFIYISIFCILLIIIMGLLSEIPFLPIGKSKYSVSFESHVLSPLTVANTLVKLEIDGKPFLDQVVGLSLEAEQTELWNVDKDAIQSDIEDFMNAYGLYCYKISIMRGGETILAESGVAPYEYETIYIDIPYARTKTTLKVAVCGVPEIKKCTDCSQLNEPESCKATKEECICGMYSCSENEYCYNGRCFDENPAFSPSCGGYQECVETCENEKTVDKGVSQRVLCRDSPLENAVCCCSTGEWDKGTGCCAEIQGGTATCIGAYG